jgi:high-affinity iron transporter
MLREGFEASLIVGIVLAFLNRTGRRDRFWVVWAGAAVALGISLAVGGLLFAIGSELEGRAEKVWEGATMLVAAGVLTWMIFWMRRQARTIKHDLEVHVEDALATGSAAALALVAFIGVLREGVETALLLFGTVEGSNALVSTVSAVIGLTGAVLIGYLFYRGAARLNLRRFFTVTSVLLLLFAGWLLTRGVHELQEAELLPESFALLAAAFVALAGPTLFLFLRPVRRRRAVSA